MRLRGCPAVPLANVLKRTQTLSNCIIASLRRSRTTRKLGTTVVSGRTPGHLGNRSNSTDKSFLIRSIWRSRGALSGHFIYCAFLLPFSSFRKFERTVLGAYRWLSDNYERGDCIFLFGALEQYVTSNMSVDAEGSNTGFSRGAFQVRVLSAMIDKVCYVLRALAAPINIFGKI